MKKMFIAISLLFSLTITSANAVEVTVEAKITGLYVAFFNRAADQAGLDYWTAKADEVAKLGGDVSSVFRTIAGGFATHPTFKSTYGDLSNKEFVEAIYRNALGRDGDAEGIAYWTDLLDRAMKRSDMVATFVELSMVTDLTKENYPNLKAEELAAAQLRQDLISNKAKVAVAFTKQLEELSNVQNSDDPEKDPAYIASIMVIAGVTEDKTTVTAALVFITEVKKSDDPIEEITASIPSWNSIAEFYDFWTNERNGQFSVQIGKVIFNGGVLTYDQYTYDPKTLQWVPHSEEDNDINSYLNMLTGVWEKESDTESYTVSTDGTILNLGNGSDSAKITSVTDLSGQTITVNEEMGLKVTFSAGAKKYSLAFKEGEKYELNWVPTLWTNQNNNAGSTFSTLEAYLNSGSTGIYSGLIQFQTTTNNGDNGAFTALDSDGNLITTLKSTTNGKLAIYDWSTNPITETIVGTWNVGALPGQPNTITIFTHLNAGYESYLEDGEKFVTVHDGKVYIGAHKEAMNTFKADDDISLNRQAIEDIKAALKSYDFSAPPATI